MGEGPHTETEKGQDTKTKERPDTEAKLMFWSAAIVLSGLLLIAVQLGAQIVLNWNGKSGLTGSYIGLVVLLVGAMLMALLAVALRRKAPKP